MRRLCLASTALLLALALASTLSRAQQVAPGPYQAVPVTLAKPLGDPALEAFRKEVTEIAKKIEAERATHVGPLSTAEEVLQRADKAGVAEPSLKP